MSIYLCASLSICSSAPSFLISTTLPLMKRASYGSFMLNMLIATRGSRLIFLVLTLFSVVLINTMSPSWSIQVVVTCGEQSFINVAMFEKFFPSINFFAFSGRFTIQSPLLRRLGLRLIGLSRYTIRRRTLALFQLFLGHNTLESTEI